MYVNHLHVLERASSSVCIWWRTYNGESTLRTKEAYALTKQIETRRSWHKRATTASASTATTSWIAISAN
jgi:hypothetical protein